MKPLADWPLAERRNIIGVFTDIDDTLTTHGDITPDALKALVDLKAAGLHIIPITGRPVGWVEPLAHRLPVDAIVAENGSVAVKKRLQPAYLLPKQLLKLYQTDTATRVDNMARMAEIAQQVLAKIPTAKLSRDHAGRETDLAFDYSEFENLPPVTVQHIVQFLLQAGMQTTVSSIHIHGCFGQFDKWLGAQWIVRELFQRDLASELDKWVFVGDSGNDQAMFQHFTHSFGVANIRNIIQLFPPQLTHFPRYVTLSERGAGFAQVTQALLQSR